MRVRGVTDAERVLNVARWRGNIRERFLNTTDKGKRMPDIVAGVAG